MSDLAALDAITEAVESGAGLPEVVRAAGRALDASLAVTDAWGATLAVAARSPAEERALLSQGKGVSTLPLSVADTVVGSLHMRARSEPSPSIRRLLATMIASEVERVLEQVRAAGAQHALVSGSGPTVVALFGPAAGAEQAARVAAALAGRDPRPLRASSVGAAFARAQPLAPHPGRGG